MFLVSDKAAYEAIRGSDPRGGAVRGLVGPRNNAVHHPEVVDPGVDHALGPLEDGRYFIFPTWVRRTDELKAMFTVYGKFSKPYASAYDDHVATRSLYAPLLDAFDFFDSLAPHLAHRGADGQLAHFPLTPPPILGSRDYFRLTPSSPHEQKQRAVLDVQKRFQLQMAPPGGRERVIDGAIELADGNLVFTGQTVLDEIHSYSFLEPHDQVEFDIRRGFRYLVSMAQAAPQTGADLFLVSANLDLADGRSLPIADLLEAAAPAAQTLRARWQLCNEDANEYGRFRRPYGATGA